ncbi:outer membrane beta-barrel protein [candidate division KSB1 bacterium]|nr:outer membrane beta-barrel protein [candidate division KSB1 bacterium]
MHRFIILASTFAVLYFPIKIQAQWSAAPQIVISIPRSDFANVSGTGGGFGVKVIRDFGGRSGFGLRGDFAFLSHGKEFTQVNIGGLFIAEVKHQSFRLTFGPQYSFGSRNFKMHGSILGGFYIFRTNTDVNTSFGFFQDSTGDAALGWNVGGGFQYDIGLGPWLDVSFEYQTIYNITTEFQVRDEQGTVIGIEKQDITANEFTIKVGVIFFLK